MLSWWSSSAFNNEGNGHVSLLLSLQSNERVNNNQKGFCMELPFVIYKGTRMSNNFNDSITRR